MSPGVATCPGEIHVAGTSKSSLMMSVSSNVVECRDDGLRGNEASKADVTQTDPPGKGCANVPVGEARLRGAEFGACHVAVSAALNRVRKPRWRWYRANLTRDETGFPCRQNSHSLPRHRPPPVHSQA